jgi:hypothetical protein
MFFLTESLLWNSNKSLRGKRNQAQALRAKLDISVSAGPWSSASTADSWMIHIVLVISTEFNLSLSSNYQIFPFLSHALSIHVHRKSDTTMEDLSPFMRGLDHWGGAAFAGTFTGDREVLAQSVTRTKAPHRKLDLRHSCSSRQLLKLIPDRKGLAASLHLNRPDPLFGDVPVPEAWGE